MPLRSKSSLLWSRAGVLALFLGALALPQLPAQTDESIETVALEDQTIEPTDQPAFAYQQMSLQLFNDAAKSLEEYHKTHAPTRETRYALLAALINFQPVTSQRIQESFDGLGELVKENPSDDIGVQAKFLQARIEQIHRDQPNVPEALRHYRELLNSQPQHPIAQRGLSRIILLELFTFKEEEFNSPEREKRAEALDEEVKKLSDPVAIRIAEMALAQAYFQFGWDKSKAMEHAERALATNMVRERTEGNFLMMVAMTAEELGQKDKALKFYKEFVEKNTRDVRTHTIKAKIAQLEGQPVAAEPTPTAIDPALPPAHTPPAPEPEPAIAP